MKTYKLPYPQISSDLLRCALAGFAISATLGLAQPALAQSEPTELLWDQPSTELPDWVRDQVIYEINVRQYSPESSFSAVEADLPRLKKLGVNTLWFMPIHPIGELNRKGKLGSYYSVKDYYGVNPEFGTPEDFRSLVDAAHAAGMHVIIDWVGNHTAWDNPLATEHPEYFVRDADGNFTPPKGTDWTDVIQLDFTQPAVLDYEADAMRHWIEDYGIDGFRCDFAVGLPTDMWDEIVARLQKVKPDVFMLAESFQGDQQLKAFQANYGWDVLHAFEAIAQGKEPAIYLDAVLNKRHLLFPQGSDFLMMTSNHDENSWSGTVFERLGGGVETFAVLAMTMDGIPLVYNGQEVGMNKRLEFFKPDPIDWDEQSPLTAFYQKLIDLKKNSPALATGAPTERISTTADEAVYAFIRGEKGGAEVLVVSNLTPKDQTFSLGGKRLGGEWKDLFTGEETELDQSNDMSLQSWDYKVLYR